MWLGEDTKSVDAKGRVLVPKAFQDGLAGPQGQPASCIVTRGFEQCIALYSPRGFQDAVQRFRTQAFVGPEARVMQRLLFSYSHPLQLDSAGRILLPEKLRTFAGLDKQAVFVGLVDRLELWDPKAWEQFDSEHGSQFDRLDQVLLGGSEEPPAEA